MTKEKFKLAVFSLCRNNSIEENLDRLIESNEFNIDEIKSVEDYQLVKAFCKND